MTASGVGSIPKTAQYRLCDPDFHCAAPRRANSVSFWRYACSYASAMRCAFGLFACVAGSRVVRLVRRPFLSVKPAIQKGDFGCFRRYAMMSSRVGVISSYSIGYTVPRSFGKCYFEKTQQITINHCNAGVYYFSGLAKKRVTAQVTPSAVGCRVVFFGRLANRSGACSRLSTRTIGWGVGVFMD